MFGEPIMYDTMRENKQNYQNYHTGNYKGYQEINQFGGLNPYETVSDF